MEKPYRVSFAGDSFDGKSWQTGIRIELAEGWKTYWRMPGEAGIPPDFAWVSSVPAEIAVSYPVPGRYADASGETVGYETEVVFPVTVTATAASAVKLDLVLFFAVCKDICIPARAEVSTELGSMARDPEGTARVERAKAAIPTEAVVASKAEIVTQEGKPALRLSLAQKVDDIFVEAGGGAYFRAPQFSDGGAEATLVIDNVADAARLKGAPLTLTFRTGKTGLEQKMTLP